MISVHSTGCAVSDFDVILLALRQSHALISVWLASLDTSGTRTLSPSPNQLFWHSDRIKSVVVVVVVVVVIVVVAMFLILFGFSATGFFHGYLALGSNEDTYVHKFLQNIRVGAHALAGYNQFFFHLLL